MNGFTPSTYSVEGYGAMIADASRREAYLQAMRQIIRPGAVVLDLGTGIGFFAMVACRLGARRVFAIEPADAIQVARELAIHNGLGDRIEFFRQVSTQVELPEPVDVVVSDLRGVLPLLQHHIATIVDVRTRFLAPDATLIPWRDRLVSCLVEYPAFVDQHVRVWETQFESIDLEPARRFAVNGVYRAYLTREQCLSDPVCWAILDYTTRVDPNVSERAMFTVGRRGWAHGCLLWFEADLTNQVSFSNSPTSPRAIYGQLFLPFARPLEVQEGDRIEIHLQARLIADDYVWKWDTTFHPVQSNASRTVEFVQTTFAAVPLSPRLLQRRDADHIPTLAASGSIDRLILSSIDGQRSLGDIARAISSKFPATFPTWQDAMSRVGELANRYS